MGRMLPQVVVLVLLAILVGAPVIWRPPESVRPADALTLTIFTPHNEQIRYEISRAFSDWHEQRFGRPVSIQWRVGGSGEIQRILTSQYRAELRQAIAQGRAVRSVGYDVVFGGGDYMFDKYFKRVGVTAPDPDARDGIRRVSITQSIRLSEELIRRVYQDGKIADARTYDPDGHWWGVILSSFGIVYNRDALGDLGLAEPARWVDLTDPVYRHRLALADPSHSGSVRVTYNAILQRLGWDTGWRVLRRLFANARYFSTSSAKIPLDVSAGEATAGICIDFYGRYQAQMVGGNRIGYIAPAGTTVYACDPVAVLNGVTGQRLELAVRFVEFLLSYEGQAIWCFRAGDTDGPKQYELRRPPVSHELYIPQRMARMVDPVNYYAAAVPLKPGTPNYMGVVSEVLHAMAIDTHDDLKSAWDAVNRETDPLRRTKMLELFDELPFTQAELIERSDEWERNPDLRERDRIEWSRFFRERYLRLVEGRL
ncbi:MAG: hypothetical protein Kow00105_15900 [Phycisphaeraceae bacterium]